MTHPKILIAEAEPLRAKMYQSSLQADGFEVMQATDSAKAWRMLKNNDFVMAIIDAQLPGLREHNVLLYVRRNHALAKLPVMILGDALEADQVVAWLNQGADDFLSRSVSSELLRAEVHAKLRRGRV